MSKEVGYIWQGFFLLLVVLAGMGIVQLLATIRPDTSSSDINDVVFAKQATISRSISFNLRGQTLFQQNCASCHSLDKDIEGPALENVEERVKDKQLLYAWIKNNAAVLKTGNPYFTNLYNKWNKTPMNIFPNLQDEEIDDILTYIKQKKAAKPSF